MRRFLSICGFSLAVTLHAQTTHSPAVTVPDNLGLGLKQLVEASARDPLELQSRLTSTPLIQADVLDRVVANIQLNGEKPVAEVQAALFALGLEIIAVDER